MRLIANNEICEAHGQCSMIDEKLFTLDDDGYISIGSGKDIAAAQEDAARRGVSACPLQALRLE